MNHRFGVIGAGSWGTTLADLLSRKGFEVTLWAREPEVAEEIATRHRNSAFVPDLELCPKIRVFCDPHQALETADIAVFAVPSGFLRATVEPLAGRLKHLRGLVNVAKGLEARSGNRLSSVFLEALGITEHSPEDRVAVLSGPNLAGEVAAKKSGATVIACPDAAFGQLAQEAFSTPYFRVYRHTDRTGVELGGTLKNVFAIGAGIVDGLGLGDNAKAAYLTRSLHEMVRLGTRLGGNTPTFYGLSGLGDLMATAASPLSRNHRFGQALAREQSESFYQNNARVVVEGVETARLAKDWGKKLMIPLPITEEICRVLFEHKSPRSAAKDLMSRSLKGEEE